MTASIAYASPTLELAELAGSSSVDLKLALGHRGADKSYHYWLFNGDSAVAYARVYGEEFSAGEVELCDIETRDEWRNQGFAKALLGLIAVEHGVEHITHSGGYTPEGYAYLPQLVKRTGLPAVSASYKSMSFVHSWEDLAPEFP